MNKQAETVRLALSVDQFCVAHGISRAFFYKLKKAGLAPVVMKVGKRSLVSYESAECWRRMMEEQANKEWGE